jgi:hypothetical protein
LPGAPITSPNDPAAAGRASGPITCAATDIRANVEGSCLWL